MLTKILQKFAIDLLKVCQIGEVQTAQQLAFFNRIFLRGYHPALLSAGTLNREIFYRGTSSALACLPGKAQANTHFVLEQLFT